MAKEIEQLQKIISLTEGDKIVWSMLNPNTFRWITLIEGKQYFVTLQNFPIANIMSNQQVFQYNLTIQIPNTGEILLLLQSNPNVNTDYYPQLKNLFEIVSEKTKIQSELILDKLLDNIK